MPARVHAVLVVRPDGRSPARAHLRRTLAALQAQTRPVDRLTIVLCGGDAELADVAAGASADAVVTAPKSTRFAAATALADPDPLCDAVWVLTQDTAPAPEALEALAGALELAPSVAVAVPKLVDWQDFAVIVSFGVSMTRFGRAVALAEGELDQGQHDAHADVLGGDIRGLLVRREAWERLRGIDPGLGADEGLDLGVRARLAGGRVSLVAGAVVATAGDGVAGPLARTDPPAARRRVFEARRAQLHRRLVYAPMWAVPLHWLALLPLALWRTARHLVGKTPGAIGPEWAAAAIAMARIDLVARARAGIRRTRSAPWAQLAPLRISGADLRRRLDDGDPETAATAPPRGELRFFTGGGAWTVLAAAVVSVAAFPALLAWPVLGGGALAPLRDTVAQLWADAAYGQRAVGLDAVGAADPFAAVVAVIGSLWPAEPSRVLVLLWLLALPLSVLGAWFAATRITERPVLRITAAVVWALAPPLLAALSDGRPAAVLVHVLLPWLFYAGSVAHRSWSASGAASLVAAAVVACAPVLAPALLVVWVGMIVLLVVLRNGRGAARVVWLAVPAAVLAAPLAWQQVARATPLALLADPGPVRAGTQASADAAGRALLATGFPTPDPGDWGAMLGAPAWWVPLLVAPVALLALASLATRRWAGGAVLLAVSALGIVTAFLAASLALSTLDGRAVAVWPGSGLSLAWLGAIGAAVVALDALPLGRAAAVRPAIAAALMGALAVVAVPTLTASARGTGELVGVTENALPAFVAAEGRERPRLGTIVLTPQDSGGTSARVIWGSGETLGGQSTLRATRAAATEGDRATAQLAADLVSAPAGDAVAALAERGIGFVLLAGAPAPESEAARTFRLDAATQLDQRDGLDAVGQTPRGSLWRVVGEVPERAAADADVRDLARAIAFAQLGVVAVAVLLALPTAASRRAARRTPRMVGTPRRTTR